MHELTLCLNLLKTLEQQTQQQPFQRIKTIWLEVGELAGVELSALRFSFPIAAAHSKAEQARLEITSIPGRAWCSDCQHDIIIKAYFDACPDCGQYHYQITQGKELRIVKMEVE